MSRYADESDLCVHGAPASAFGTLDSATKLKALEGASADLDAVISSQGAVPLTVWGEDVRKKIVHLATYDLLCRVGFNPNAGADVNYRLRSDDARAWLRDIGKGIVRPIVTFATPRADGAQPSVRSKPLRNW